MPPGKTRLAGMQTERRTRCPSGGRPPSHMGENKDRGGSTRQPGSCLNVSLKWRTSETRKSRARASTPSAPARNGAVVPDRKIGRHPKGVRLHRRKKQEDDLRDKRPDPWPGANVLTEMSGADPVAKTATRMRTLRTRRSQVWESKTVDGPAGSPGLRGLTRYTACASNRRAGPAARPK
jgi:hypothetical protein